MQTPGNVPPAPKLVKMPPSTEPQYRHDFSPAQMDLMKVYITRLNQAEAAKVSADKSYEDCRMAIGLFIDFLQKENHMQPDVSWSLHGDSDGTPCLIGVPKTPKSKE
jgi:hypothetical protein